MSILTTQSISFSSQKNRKPVQLAGIPTPRNSFIANPGLSSCRIAPGQVPIKDSFISTLPAIKNNQSVLFGNSVSAKIWEKIKDVNNFPHTLPVLGQGVEAIVYEISDKYVIRVPRQDSSKTLFVWSASDIHSVSDDAAELKGLKDIGKRVAYIKVGSHKVYFHKKMPGQKASIDYNRLTLDGRVHTGETVQTTSRYRAHLQQVKHFPVEVYQALLWQVHQLDKAGYAIDPGSNNLLVSNNKFSIVDYNKKSVSLAAGMFPSGEENNLAYIMSQLIDMEYREKIRGGGSSEEEKLACRKILQKALIAAARMKYLQQASVKLPSSSTFHLRHINDKCCNSFTPQQVFVSCGIPPENWEPIKKALTKQSKTSSDDMERTINLIQEKINLSHQGSTSGFSTSESRRPQRPSSPTHDDNSSCIIM
jgi:hypothetical protein